MNVGLIFTQLFVLFKMVAFRRKELISSDKGDSRAFGALLEARVIVYPVAQELITTLSDSSSWYGIPLCSKIKIKTCLGWRLVSG